MRSKTEAGARNNVELAPEVLALDLRQPVARVLLREPLHRKPQIVPRGPRLSVCERISGIHLVRSALSVAVLSDLLFVTCVEINQ